MSQCTVYWGRGPSGYSVQLDPHTTMYWGWGPSGHSVQLDPHSKSVYIGGGGHLSRKLGSLSRVEKKAYSSFNVDSMIYFRNLFEWDERLLFLTNNGSTLYNANCL